MSTNNIHELERLITEIDYEKMMCEHIASLVSKCKSVKNVLDERSTSEGHRKEIVYEDGERYEIKVTPVRK